MNVGRRHFDRACKILVLGHPKDLWVVDLAKKAMGT